MPNYIPGTVTVGLATTDTPQCWEFDQSLEAMMVHSAYEGGPINRHARRLQVIGGPSLAGKRNKVVKTFLERTDSEWLLFIDDDQQFMPNLAQRMVESADPDERPIVSALIMAERTSSKLPIGPACTVMHDGHFVIPPRIPKEKHWRVATIGTGCVLIHRRVLEAMREKHRDDAFPWFKHAQHPNQDSGEPDEMSEDYVFSLRAAALGFPLYVDTTIEAGHVKRRVLTTADFYAQPGIDPPEPRTVAVIPVKDNATYTKNLVKQLQADDGCDEIVVVDNGSRRDLVDWLRKACDEVIPAEGRGIHEMWNMGAAYALSKPGPVNILYLNNDVRLGEPFCAPLAAALRPNVDGLPPEQVEQAERLVAVCPNYDGRDGHGIEQLRGVCGERYDGTGGLAGFAFMVKGELFTVAGYRFPEQCMWWYGDTDMVMTIDSIGGWYGMVHGVEVEHLDGGGRTGDWSDPAMQKQLAADQANWQAKWSQIMEQAS